MIRKVLAVLALVVCSVVVVLVIGRLGASPGPQDPFAGYWNAADVRAANGPLVIKITKTDDAYQISGLILPGGIFETANVVGSELVSSGVSPITGGAASVRLAGSSDKQTLTLTYADAGDSSATPIVLDLARVNGDQDAQTSAFQKSFNLRSDEKARQGILTLQAALQKWAQQNNGKYPPTDGVAPKTAFATLVAYWPVNAATGAEMVPGSEPGNYSYTTTGDSYALGTTLSNGTVFEVR